MFGYHVPAPDEAMLISGGKSRGDVPFRVVTGHGAFVLPFVRKYAFLTLSMFEAEVNEPCVTKQGIALSVTAVIAAKIGNDQESIVNAAQRFLSDQNQMSALTGRIFAGHLRSIIGSMTVEEIITERQKLATEVLDGSKDEMAKIGLIVDALQIQSIDDMGLGYVKAMAAPHNAAYPADGADRTGGRRPGRGRGAAAIAAEAGRVRARHRRHPRGLPGRDPGGRAEGLAGRPARPGAGAAGGDRRADRLAQRQAELRQQQLVSEVVRPAEAEAERVRILAKADAERTEIQAAAAASSNRVALDQLLIEQLPLIVEKAAGGLANANVTVLNGSDGLSDVVSGLVGQGLAIFDSLRANVGTDKKDRPAIGNNAGDEPVDPTA